MHKSQELAKIALGKKGFKTFKTKSKPKINSKSENRKKIKNKIKSKTTIAMQKTYNIKDIPTNIKVAIETTIHPEYPQFYINDKNIFLKYPHIERDDGGDNFKICLTEDNKKRLFPSVEALIENQVAALEKYIDDINSDKFPPDEIYKEFDSYWKSINGVILYENEMFEQSTKYKEISLLVQKREFSKQYFVKNNNGKISEYLNSHPLDSTETKGVFLNFDNYFPEKIPYDHKELAEVIVGNNLEEEVRNYRTQIKGEFVVIFSFMLPTGERHFAALTIYGTAINKTLYSILFGSNMQSKEIKGIDASSISRERIYSRGGDEVSKKTSLLHKKIAIVGCGSVGAPLAQKLFKSGVTSISLIDKSRLKIDNIGRHYLGLESVGVNKATALADKLKQQYHDNNIIGYQGQAEEYLNILKSMDLIILALGSDGTEVQEKIIIDVINKINPPVITCWLEAKAVAGHALLFDKRVADSYRDGNEFNLLDIYDAISVVDKEYAKSLVKEDVGCNATYMPYSYVNSDIHVNHFAIMIIKHLQGTNTKTTMSSYGDLKDIPEEYLRIEKENSFSIKKDAVIKEV